MKISKAATNHHMDDAAFYYSTSLTADTSNSLPSPPSSFYDKSSHDAANSFYDGSVYGTTIKKTATTLDTQPQNYTIDHSFITSSPAAAAPPTLSTSYDSNSDNENMTIHHSPPKQHVQQHQHCQSLLPTTAMLLDFQHRYSRQASTDNRIELNDTNDVASETDLRSCHECGKIYKHPSCLYKHLWEHSEGWELTSKLPLTKHQQVQILEAATILIGMSAETKLTNSLSSSSSSSSLVDIQSVYRPYDDGGYIDIDDDDQDPMVDDGSDIISIVDDDDDPSSY